MPGPTIQDVLDRIDTLRFQLEYKRQEYNNTGDTIGRVIRGNLWKAQSFTPQNNHQIAYVRLKCYRDGSPGLLTVSIRATNYEGKPTGLDLITGTINADAFVASAPGNWYVIPFEMGPLLTKDTEYAIVVRALDGSGTNSVFWRSQSTGVYPGGRTSTSSDAGESWIQGTEYDSLFEEFEDRFSTMSTMINEINTKLDAGGVEVYTESQHAQQG